MSVEPVVAAFDLPHAGSAQCWCCGSLGPPDRMVRLSDHPEVHLCLGCAHYVHQEARQVEGEGKRTRRLGTRVP